MITVAHSPDADDRFMFWPLRTGRLRSPYPLTFRECDTQRLNTLCLAGEVDVCAISVAHYPAVAKAYQPLRMGCSVGVGYGPVLVRPSEQDFLCHQNEQTKAVLLSPGLQTTSHAALAVLGYSFEKVECVPISPMEQVFERIEDLRNKRVGVAALLIHEGRLLYQKYDLSLILDLGETWQKHTNGPLPLGMNVIARRLSLNVREELSALFRESCLYALEHRDEFVEESGKTSSEFYSPLNARELSHYLDLYANQDTLEASPVVRSSVESLVGKVTGRFQESVCDWI